MEGVTDIKGKLEEIVGKKLQYLVKWDNCELFQLGFGDELAENESACKELKLNQFAIHFTSAIFFYWKDRHADKFYEDVTQAQLHKVAGSLLGKSVSRVALSDKNDLWLDFGVCRVVIPTREDGEESWRFICAGKGEPHILASDICICTDE